LNLPYDIRVIYTDGNGQKIGDSNSLLSNKSESFADLNSFKNGKSGNCSETINGTKFLVSYSSKYTFKNMGSIGNDKSRLAIY
jgi:hypothetical protein